MRLFGDDSSSRWRSYYQTSYLIIANNAGFSTGILKNVRLLDNDCVLLERSFFMSKQSPKNNEKTDVTVDDLEKEMQGRFNALNQSYQKVRLSRQPLYKAIFGALPPLERSGSYATDEKICKAWNNAFKIIYGWKITNPKTKKSELNGGMGGSSRNWFISRHWLFDVCNPKLDKSNYKYSPFRRSVTWSNVTVKNDFGELSKLEPNEVGDALVEHRQKVLPDATAVKNGYWNFGSSWDHDGYIVLTDASGVRPALDGWTKHIYNQVDHLMTVDTKSKSSLKRHSRAFMVFHTLDMIQDVTNAQLVRDGVHVHVDAEMSKKYTRLQMMKFFGFDVDFWIKTLQWASQEDQPIDRVSALLSQIIAEMKNYEKTWDVSKTRKYLVHQSTDAINKEKATYRPGEVFSWLPRQHTTYEDLSGVYDDTPINVGHATIVRNLHNSINTKNNTASMVGHRMGDNRFTYAQLAELREHDGNIGTFFDMVYKDECDVNDYSDMIKGSLNENTAMALLTSNGNDGVMTKYNLLKADYVKMQSKQPLNKSTFFLHSQNGGAGKTRLANALGAARNQWRDGYNIVAKEYDKTFDPFGGYDGQRYYVGDEITADWFSYSEFKNLIDPHKNVTASSRYNDVPLWNIRDGYFTQVMNLSDLIKNILRFSPGITNRGYLEKNPAYRDGDDDNAMYRVKRDADSQRKYVRDLSQIVRRMKYDIAVEPLSSKRTRITVSIVNFRSLHDDAPLDTLKKIGYVHTENSTHVFNTAIDDQLSDDDMKKLAKHVAKMVEELTKQAEQAFDNGVECLADDHDFIVTPMDFFDDQQQQQSSRDTEREQREEFNRAYDPMFDNKAYGPEESPLCDKFNRLRVKVNLGGQNVLSLTVGQLVAMTDGYSLVNNREHGKTVTFANGYTSNALSVWHDATRLSLGCDDGLLLPINNLINQQSALTLSD